MCSQIQNNMLGGVIRLNVQILCASMDGELSKSLKRGDVWRIC